MNKLYLYYHTIRYLKFTQVVHRIRNIIRNKTGYTVAIPVYKNSNRPPLNFQKSIPSYTTWYGNNTFKFLNKEKKFDDRINWNFREFGKLWTYNINYFEFLHQDKITSEQGLAFINDFIARENEINDGLEPFPTSLRLINWIKFVVFNEIKKEEIDQFIHRDAYRLYNNLEYHLLGNHLLENGFGLFFAGHYLNDVTLIAKSLEILKSELKEQILEDGGHFELSPMYHQHMLFRVLDCYNLAMNNHLPLEKEIAGYAKKMLSWLKNITFLNGSIPLFNDSSNQIAPDSISLFNHAEKLKIDLGKTELSDSGYRRFDLNKSTMIVDYGKPGPDYIPGHAHADIFNFEFYYGVKPVIVDTGTSTYEVGTRRQTERGTGSHNTVTIDDLDQSNVWGSFRLAQRASVEILNESFQEISGEHDGYKDLGIYHQRTLKLDTGQFVIEDIIKAKHNNYRANFHLHFHPEIKWSISGNEITTDAGVKFIFENNTSITKENYSYAPEFNKLFPAEKALVTFKSKLLTTIVS